MKTISAALAMLLLSASIATGQDANELAAQLKEVEKERDMLRRELALAKLKIATLEDKLASLGGKDDSKTKTADGETGKADEGDDDVDESGISKKSRLWDVKVVSSKPLDSTQLDQEIASLKNEVRTAAREKSDAQSRLDRMRRDNDLYSRDYERRKDLGLSVGTKRMPFNDSALGEALLAVQKAANRERVASSRVLGLEREKAEAARTLIVTCELVSDGSTVRLMAKGGAYTLAESMVAGRRYVVEGRSSGLDTIMLTKVTASE